MAKKYEGITLKIGGDTTELSKALKKPQTETSKLQTSLREVNKALKMDTGNVDLVTSKQKLLTQAVDKTEEQLKLMKTAYKQALDDENVDKTSGAFIQLQTEITKTEAKLKALKSEQSGLPAGVEAFGNKMQSAGEKASELGSKTKVASGIAAGALVVATKSAVDFETAFAGVIKTVDGTPEQLQKIKDGILDLATVSGTSSTEIAGVAEAAGQLGIKTDDVMSFTKTMVMLGDATNMTAEEAATSMAKIANITGMTADEYDRFGSAVTWLGNNFATTEADIVAMTNKLASSGKIAGLSNQEMLALATSMSSVGIEAEAGGTAMSQTLAAIETAVAKGGEDLQKFANVAGVSSEQFATTWNDKPIEAITSFLTGLGGLEEKGENATLVLDDMGLSGIRQSNMLKALSLSADSMKGAVDGSNKAWSENTALSDEANKRWETTERQAKGLIEEFKKFAITLGEILLPVLKVIMGVIQGVAKWLNGLDPTIKNVIVAVVAFIASISPVLTILGKLFIGISKIIQIFGIVAKVVGVVVGAIGIIPVVIAAVIAVFVLLYTKCEWFRDGVNNIIKTVVKFFKNFAKGVVEVFNNVINSITQWVTNFINFFTVTLPNGIKAGVDAIINWFAQLPYNIGLFIGTIIGFILKFYQRIFEFYTVDIPNFVRGVIEWFAQLPGKIAEFISTIISNIASFASNLLTKGIEAGSNFVNSVVNFVKNLPGNVMTWLNNTISNLATFVSNMASKGVEAASNLVTNVVNGVSSLPGKMMSIGGDIVEGIWDGITGMGDWLMDKISSFADGVVDGIAGFFGIHSPSTVMRDKIGHWLPLGIGEGFEDEMPTAQKQMMNALDKSMSTMQKGVDDALTFDMNKNVELSTISTHSASMLDSMKDNILTAVDNMLGSINIQNSFAIGTTEVANEVTPLVNKNMGKMAKRGK